MIIQRSVSERTREKCLRSRHSGSRGLTFVECPHRVRKVQQQECSRHGGSRLKHQARLEYVQSTPNVATISGSKFGPSSPRGGELSSCDGGRGGVGIGVGRGKGGMNVSKLYSAVSDGELLDVAILPIFQKLLSERHKSHVTATAAARPGYGVASCPNISIKCDIVEYL